MKRLVLIDGHAVLYRAFHALPPLTSSNGQLVNAVYGFVLMLLKVYQDLKPDYLVVAFDLPIPTFRHETYIAYQATRPHMDDGLKGQIVLVKEVVESARIPIFTAPGFEADDVIGTLARTATDEADEKDNQVIIVTGDRDSLQLIKDRQVVVYLPIHNHHAQSEVFDEDRVVEVYGLRPDQMIDLKALMGDASDNIPGVKGIGKVTATSLIKEFGSLGGVYKNIDSEKIRPKVRNLLVGGREMADKSRELAEINRHVPLDFDWEACLLTNYDKEKAVRLFEELSFRSLIIKLPKDIWEKEAEEIFV